MELPIPDVPLLNADEEIDLARQLEAGLFAAEALAAGASPLDASPDELQVLVELGGQAQQRLFLSNLRLVALHARGWAQRSSLPVEDLFQEGCVGLARAIQTWDHTRGVRFGTWAWRSVGHMVLGAVLTRAGQAGSAARQRAVWQTRREWCRLEVELGRSVSIRELADHLGKDEDLISGYVHARPPSELPAELAAPPARPDLTARLPAWLAELAPNDRQLLAARYGIGQEACTLSELAQRLGTSPSSARRLEAKALAAARRVLIEAGAA